MGDGVADGILDARDRFRDRLECGHRFADENMLEALERIRSRGAAGFDALEGLGVLVGAFDHFLQVHERRFHTRDGIADVVQVSAGRFVEPARVGQLPFLGGEFRLQLRFGLGEFIDALEQVAAADNEPEFPAIGRNGSLRDKNVAARRVELAQAVVRSEEVQQLGAQDGIVHAVDAQDLGMRLLGGNRLAVNKWLQFREPEQASRLVGRRKHFAFRGDEQGRCSPRQAQLDDAVEHFAHRDIEPDNALQFVTEINRCDARQHPSASRGIGVDAGPARLALRVVLRIGLVEKIEAPHVDLVGIDLPRAFDEREVAVGVDRLVGVDVGRNHIGGLLDDGAVERIERDAFARKEPVVFAHRIGSGARSEEARAVFEIGLVERAVRRAVEFGGHPGNRRGEIGEETTVLIGQRNGLFFDQSKILVQRLGRLCGERAQQTLQHALGDALGETAVWHGPHQFRRNPAKVKPASSCAALQQLPLRVPPINERVHHHVELEGNERFAHEEHAAAQVRADLGGIHVGMRRADDDVDFRIEGAHALRGFEAVHDRHAHVDDADGVTDIRFRHLFERTQKFRSVGEPVADQVPAHETGRLGWWRSAQDVEVIDLGRGKDFPIVGENIRVIVDDEDCLVFGHGGSNWAEVSVESR